MRQRTYRRDGRNGSADLCEKVFPLTGGRQSRRKITHLTQVSPYAKTVAQANGRWQNCHVKAEPSGGAVGFRWVLSFSSRTLSCLPFTSTVKYQTLRQQIWRSHLTRLSYGVIIAPVSPNSMWKIFSTGVIVSSRVKVGNRSCASDD